MSTPAIRVDHLSKRYEIGLTAEPSLRHTLNGLFTRRKKVREFWALKDISFEIQKGEAVGIVGKNGAGKSTLLKILSKITYPTSGQATLYGRIASLLEVGTGFHPELTGRENIYLNGSLLGMTKHEINSSLDEIIDFSGVSRFVDTPVKRYSSGMYMRLAFAVAAHLRTEILLVDEVLAVGDIEFQKKCLGKMDSIAHSGKTIIFVSHNTDAIIQLCPRSLLLDEGRLIMQGESSEVVAQYTKQELTQTNVKTYGAGSVLKRVSVQYDSHLKIEAQYAFAADIMIPHLGFSISDHKHNTLFTSNPSLEKVNMNDQYASKGTVRAIVSSPKLSTGQYYLSLWFGTGSKDLVVDQNALSFTVPTSESTSRAGNIIPVVNYLFEGES